MTHKHLLEVWLAHHRKVAPPGLIEWTGNVKHTPGDTFTVCAKFVFCGIELKSEKPINGLRVRHIDYNGEKVAYTRYGVPKGQQLVYCCSVDKSNCIVGRIDSTGSHSLCGDVASTFCELVTLDRITCQACLEDINNLYTFQGSDGDPEDDHADSRERFELLELD